MQQIEWWYLLVNLVELFLYHDFRMGVVKGRRKIGTKNAQKFVHKVIKQQTEWWHHLANLAELIRVGNGYKTNTRTAVFC